MSADSSGNGHRLNTIRPTIPQGHWGGLGGHKLKYLGKLSYGWTDWHHIWYNITGGILGGFRGSQIQKYVEAVKRLDRLTPNLAHMCRFIWEWTYAKYKSPHNTPGDILGGFRGSQIQMSGEAVKLLDRLGIPFARTMQVNLGMDTG